MKTDILVIGAGPVGLFTVFEAGLLGLNCTLIDNLDKPGGQCAELYPDKPIFDIPGVPYQTAQEHVYALLKQIEPFEYDLILNERVESMTKKNDLWEVSTNKGTKIETPNIFIAAGAGSFEPIKPNLECDFSALEGKKIFYSIKDKTIFKEQKVAIFGGGDSALDWTVELQKIGANVSLIHRRDAFRGAPDTEMNVISFETLKVMRTSIRSNYSIQILKRKSILMQIIFYFFMDSTRNLGQSTNGI